MIGTELYKTVKITKDKNVNEEKKEESKVDNVEESHASITSIKNEDDTVEEVN